MHALNFLAFYLITYAMKAC